MHSVEEYAASSVNHRRVDDYTVELNQYNQLQNMNTVLIEIKETLTPKTGV